MKNTFFNTAIGGSLLFIISCNESNVPPQPKAENSVSALQFDYTKIGMGNILIDSQTTYKYKNNFEGKIRRFPLGIVNDKVSQSVWFSKDALLLLASYLQDSTNKLDGVRIHLISYDSLNTAPGQYKPHQVSIVMVPTIPKASDPKKHIDNWDILKFTKYKADSIFEKTHFVYGLNHGELCPQVCN